MFVNVFGQVYSYIHLLFWEPILSYILIGFYACGYGSVAHDDTVCITYGLTICLIIRFITVRALPGGLSGVGIFDSGSSFPGQSMMIASIIFPFFSQALFEIPNIGTFCLGSVFIVIYALVEIVVGALYPSDTIVGYLLGKGCIMLFEKYGEIPYYGNIVLIVLLVFFLPNANKIGGTLACLTFIPVQTCRIQLAWVALLKVLLDYVVFYNYSLNAGMYEELARDLIGALLTLFLVYFVNFA